MLGQLNMFGQSKVDLAIKRLRAFEPEGGYYLAFSGGKDSQCVYHLAEMAGVAFDAHYSVTSVDPPELMRFIREHYPDVKWEYPMYQGKRCSMWTLIADHTVPPTRMVRYCCDVLKEQHGQGRVAVTGVRWAESQNRRKTHGVVDMRTRSKRIIHEQLENNDAAKLNSRGGLIFLDDNEETRKAVEYCYQKRRTTLNPIIDWDEEEVWEFLNEVAKVPHCSLYDEGFTRLGCIGCPLQGREGMKRDFERWPRYKELYIRAFDKMIKNHPGEIRIATGQTAEPGGAEQASRNGSNGRNDARIIGRNTHPKTRTTSSDGGSEWHIDVEMVDVAHAKSGRKGRKTTGVIASRRIERASKGDPITGLEAFDAWLNRDEIL